MRRQTTLTERADCGQIGARGILEREPATPECVVGVSVSVVQHRTGHEIHNQLEQRTRLLVSVGIGCVPMREPARICHSAQS